MTTPALIAAARDAAALANEVAARTARAADAADDAAALANQAADDAADAAAEANDRYAALTGEPNA